jgi:UDP-N-acetylglucosamine acyltransferase
MSDIHPTAIVEDGAKLGDGVHIGPYCRVGPEVELGARVRLESHVVITGRTRIGEDCKIYPFASLGQPPQDLKYAGEPSELLIGAKNTIREYVTMNPGTKGGGMVTEIGDGCLLMAGAHVAHDCRIGDSVILANSVALGGHVIIGEAAIVGGLVGIHQFVRIGRNAMIGGVAGVGWDVIPFGATAGNTGKLQGLNLVGLKRRGFPRSEIDLLRAAFRQLFLSGGQLQENIDQVAAQYGASALVQEVISFLRAPSDRGYQRAEVDGERE